MNTIYVSVQAAVVLVVLHSSYALFYTNSKENDYPRIGKRPLSPHIFTGLNAKDLRELARSIARNNDFTKTNAKPLSQPISEVMSPLDLFTSSESNEEIEDLLSDSLVSRSKGSDVLLGALQAWLTGRQHLPVRESTNQLIGQRR